MADVISLRCTLIKFDAQGRLLTWVKPEALLPHDQGFYGNTDILIDKNDTVLHDSVLPIHSYNLSAIVEHNITYGKFTITLKFWLRVNTSGVFSKTLIRYYNHVRVFDFNNIAQRIQELIQSIANDKKPETSLSAPAANVTQNRDATTPWNSVDSSTSSPKVLAKLRAYSPQVPHNSNKTVQQTIPHTVKHRHRVIIIDDTVDNTRIVVRISLVLIFLFTVPLIAVLIYLVLQTRKHCVERTDNISTLLGFYN